MFPPQLSLFKHENSREKMSAIEFNLCEIDILLYNISMYSELGQNYKEKLLPLSGEKLPLLNQQGIGFSGVAHIDDNYVILRSKGYYQHLVLYTLSGEGWMRSEGKDHILKSGDIWISPAEVPHEYGIFGKTWKILWISLGRTSRWNTIDDIGTIIRKSNLGSVMDKLFSSIIRSVSGEYFNTTDEIEHLSELMLIYLDRELSLKSIHPKEREIQNRFNILFSRVNQSIHQNWDIEKLQNAMGKHYAEDHFIRLCRQYYGQTPIKVVTGLKMQKAWELVCNTNLPIQTVSEKVGYTNPYAFTTAFKRYWKLPPIEVRKQKK